TLGRAGPQGGASPLPHGGIREIPASAEGLSGSRHDEYERIVVVPKALPGVLELRVHPAVDRVARIGPVVGETGHLVLARVSDRFIVHLRLLQLVQFSQASLPDGVAVEPGCPPFISGARSPQKRRGNSDSGGSATPGQVTPDSFSRLRAAVVKPISARISSVCSPKAGAPERTRVGVRENFAAGPVIGAVDPSSRRVGCSMSRSRT